MAGEAPAVAKMFMMEDRITTYQTYQPARTIAALLAVMLLCACGHRQVSAGPAAPQPTKASAAQPVEPGQARQSASEEPDADFAAFDEFDQEFARAAVQVADPLEPINRAIFVFNDRLYFWVLKPMAQGYNFILPGAARRGVRNFFSNLFTPIRFVNCILQGKGNAAATEVVRLITNTTLGVAGFWDPAMDLYGVEISNEDLGQTLGAYGIGNGFYLVWPVLGPNSLRDTVGFFGDLYVNPINYLEPTSLAFGVGLYRRFNDLSLRIGDYEAVKQAAVDPYVAFRDGYIQFRRSLIEQ